MKQTLGRPALVLSGGGVRGAYEVGVIKGIVDVLGLGEADRAPFRLFTGTSVGAINAAYLAANAHRGDLGVDQLVSLWTRFEIERDLRVDPLGLWGWPRRRTIFGRRKVDAEALGPRLGRSVLDPRPLEKIVRESIDWNQLHKNAAQGVLEALVIAALEIKSGRTTMFAELSSGTLFRPSKDPHRHAQEENITSDHVLASAAIPILFPARRVGSKYYCDGGIRFNTPIAPAIRTGADRLCVVSLMHRREQEPIAAEAADHTIEYPKLSFLLGKLLNALLLDSAYYDLQVLQRFNRLLEVLEGTLTLEEMERVQTVLLETRGARYRTLKTLVFAPTQDIGMIAGEHVQKNLADWDLGALPRWLLRKVAQPREGREADFASYLLFEGGFAQRLIDLGKQDAHARADEIHEFFGN